MYKSLITSSKLIRSKLIRPLMVEKIDCGSKRVEIIQKNVVRVQPEKLQYLNKEVQRKETKINNQRVPLDRKKKFNRPLTELCPTILKKTNSLRKFS